MLTKHLLTISILLPFMAISSAVHADHNYQHRPNQPAGYAAFNQAGPPPDASNTELQGRPALQPRNSRNACTYQGDRNPACGPVDKRRPAHCRSAELSMCRSWISIVVVMGGFAWA